MKGWRLIVGESWDIGALADIMERWDTFALKYERLIYRAIINFKDSRKELAEVLDSMVR